MNDELNRRLAAYHQGQLNILPAESEEWRRHAALLQLVVFIGIEDRELATDQGDIEHALRIYPELQASAIADHPPLRRGTEPTPHSLWHRLDDEDVTE